MRPLIKRHLARCRLPILFGAAVFLVLLAGLWVRSYHRQDVCWMGRNNGLVGLGGHVHWSAIQTARGELYVDFGYERLEMGENGGVFVDAPYTQQEGWFCYHYSLKLEQFTLAFDCLNPIPKIPKQFGGFGEKASTYDYIDPLGNRNISATLQVMLPLWFPTALAAAILLLSLMAEVRRRRQATWRGFPVRIAENHVNAS